MDNGIQVRDSLLYDNSNNITKIDGHQLMNGTWIKVSFIDYTYDANGNSTSRLNYNSFGGTTFTLGGVYNYHYENNQLTSWELLMGGTDLVKMATLTYNTDGKIVKQLAQDTWNSGSFENSWKIDYIYNTDGTLKTSNQSFWDGISSWDSAGGDWFYYDDNKNCIKWEFKSGNTVTNKNEYEYNLDFTVDQIVFPINPEEQALKKGLVEMNNMVTLNHWYTENDQGNLVYICDYIYSYDLIGIVGVPIHDQIVDNLRIYPNPTSDLITVSSGKKSIQNIDIIDTMEKLVFKESNLNKKETNLDLSSLSSGVYYIRLSTSKGIVTQKLVKQ